MKHWLPLVVSLFAVAARAATWQEELTPLTPGSFPPLRPLHAHYKFGWSAFTAADADFDYAKTKNNLLRLGVKTHTNGFVRTLWRMDAEQTSQIRADSFSPTSVVQTETYRDETRTTRLAFDDSGVTRNRVTVPPPPSQKPKRFDFAPLYDINGALQMVRSQPLKAGDVYKLVVYAGSAPYLAQVTVLGRDKVEAGGRKYDGIKSDVKLSRIDDDDLELKPYTKLKNATVWLSDDADRMLLKIQAEIFVGSVWAELDSVQFARRP